MALAATLEMHKDARKNHYPGAFSVEKLEMSRAIIGASVLGGYKL